MRPSLTRWLSPLALCLLAACGSTGPDALDLSGEWSGVMSFNSGFTTYATLDQTGGAVSGTLRTSAGFINGEPLTGTVSQADRTFTWAVGHGCELWSGVLTIDAGGASMTGPILVDKTGCSSGSNSSGTLSLTRQ